MREMSYTGEREPSHNGTRTQSFQYSGFHIRSVYDVSESPCPKAIIHAIEQSLDCKGRPNHAPTDKVGLDGTTRGRRAVPNRGTRKTAKPHTEIDDLIMG